MSLRFSKLSIFFPRGEVDFQGGTRKEAASLAFCSVQLQQMSNQVSFPFAYPEGGFTAYRFPQPAKSGRFVSVEASISAAVVGSHLVPEDPPIRNPGRLALRGCDWRIESGWVPVSIACNGATREARLFDWCLSSVLRVGSAIGEYHLIGQQEHQELSSTSTETCCS